MHAPALELGRWSFVASRSPRSFAILLARSRVAPAGGTDYSVVLVGSSSALRFLRRLRLGRPVEDARLSNERLEGGRVDFLSFRDVDRAAYVSVEARVEETGRILQGRTLGEGELHDLLVGFAGADETVVRPD